MTKTTAKRKINKILSETSPGIYSDEYWTAVHAIFNALDAQGYSVQLSSSQYHHGLNGQAISKEWRFDILFDGFTLHGMIMAHGAGSVADPLDRYDISAYCW